MGLKNQLVIMAKAPQVGRVKTRLANGIGPVASCYFYKRMVKNTIMKLSHESWESTLYVTPDHSIRFNRLWGGKLPVIGQGAGDLGTKMRKIMRRESPGPIVIVGTDIPDITPKHINHAFRALGNFDAVFGPSTDGGYWLVGLKRRPALIQLFRDVRWSTKFALGDTIANLPPKTKIKLLEFLTDVDDYQSYKKVITSPPL